MARRNSGMYIGSAGLALLIVATLAAGCADQSFARSKADSVVLGQSTETETRGRWGPPYRESTTLVNGERLKTLAYAYAEAGRSPAGGVIPSRGKRSIFLERRRRDHRGGRPRTPGKTAWGLSVSAREGQDRYRAHLPLLADERLRSEPEGLHPAAPRHAREERRQGRAPIDNRRALKTM